MKIRKPALWSGNVTMFDLGTGTALYLPRKPKCLNPYS